MCCSPITPCVEQVWSRHWRKARPIYSAGQMFNIGNKTNKKYTKAVQISGLIFSRRSLRLDDSLHYCRHAMYKVQTEFLANFGAPRSFYSSSEVVRTFRVFLGHSDLEETPQVFNRIHAPWWVVTAPPQFRRTGAVPSTAHQGRAPAL